jgi:hypothetical protein
MVRVVPLIVMEVGLVGTGQAAAGLPAPGGGGGGGGAGGLTRRSNLSKSERLGRVGFRVPAFGPAPAAP